MGVVTGMRVLPSLAVLFVLIPCLGLSLWSAALALTLLARIQNGTFHRR